jgi:transposase-like protein/transposase Tn5 family protein
MDAAQPSSNRDWIERELGEVRLGDARLDRRLLEVASRIADRPTATNPQRLDWNELRGLYRVVHAPRAQPHLLQEPHRLNTRERMRACPSRVLIVHDTTELDFTDHPALHHCLGPIGTGGGFGLLQHNSIAFDPEGKQILGLVFQQLVQRKPCPANETRAERARRSNKESQLWLTGIHGVGTAPAAKRWIHVCDRGGDFLEAMQLTRDKGHEFLIRIHQNRRVAVAGADEETEQGRQQIRSLHETIGEITSATTKVVTVASRGGRPAREVTVRVGSRPVELQPPQPDGARRGLRPVPVTLIRVWEEGVDAARAAAAEAKAVAKAAEAAVKAAEAAARPARSRGARAEASDAVAAAKAESAAAKEAAKAATARVETYLDWWLGTNGPIETVADVERAVSDYEWRWPVAEEYHKVEKSGLKIESQRFESHGPLVAALAILAVVAIRVLQLRYARDSHPEAAAETIATAEEIELVGRATKRVGRVLSVKQFVDAVARLGGHLGRKGDGPPGWATLWRGYQRLKDMLLGAELMRDTVGGEVSPDEGTLRDPPGGA